MSESGSEAGSAPDHVSSTFRDHLSACRLAPQLSPRSLTLCEFPLRIFLPTKKSSTGRLIFDFASSTLSSPASSSPPRLTELSHSPPTMSRSNPPSRPGSSSSFSRPHQTSDGPSGSSSSDYSGAFGGTGTILKSKTREAQTAPTTRRSTPQPLHATPGVRITQAKPKANHGGGAVLSDLLGGSSSSGGGAKPVKAEGKKPEKLSDKAEALSIRIRDVESVEFDEAGGSNVGAMGKRQLKKAKGGCFCQGELGRLLLAAVKANGRHF